MSDIPQEVQAAVDATITLTKCKSALEIDEQGAAYKDHRELISEINARIDDCIIVVCKHPEAASDLSRVLAGTVEP